MGDFLSRYQIRAVASTTIGGRSENQDDFCVLDTPSGCLAVVCDGMGGGPGGRTASFIAKKVVRDVVCSAPVGTPREEILRNAIAAAQNVLQQQERENPSLKGMGTTVVAALINERSAVIAHLGDSRCYRVSGRRMMFKTPDHSLVAELVRKKSLTEEEARLSPQSNIITRGLGSVDNHTPEINEVPFRKGDRFVICTDGVWGMLPHDALMDRFTSQADIQQIMMSLQQEVDKMGYASGGHHDNHSLVILELGMNSILKDRFDKTTIAIIASLAGLLLVSLIVNIVTVCSYNSKDKLKDEEIERLSAYEHRYKDLIDENGLKYSQILNILVKENDSLRNVVSQQQRKMDDIHKEKVKAEQDQKQEPTEIQAAVSSVVKKLEGLRDIDYPESAAANQQKASRLNKIVTDVEKLDKDTKGRHKAKINNIKTLLKNTNLQKTKKVENGFGYDKPTKEQITKIINIIKEIK